MSPLIPSHFINQVGVIMLEEYAPWIALLSAIGGMMVGYFMGYRTGRIAGELAALKSTRSRRDRTRSMRHPTPEHHQDSHDDDLEDSEYESSRRVPRHSH